MFLSAIDHLQIAALSKCEVAARKFFDERLGLEEIAKPEAHPAFSVANIQACFERLQRAGIVCVRGEDRGRGKMVLCGGSVG